MAIQLRRGIFSRFDPSRLLPGEVAVVTSGDPTAADGKAAYLCFAAGTTKRLATREDIAQDIAEALDDAGAIESITVNGTEAVVANRAATVTLPAASQSDAGLMSATDKEKLDAITAQGGVKTANIANEAVTDAKLSPTGIRAKVASLAGNVLRGTRSGAVVTASDAYAAPPLGLTVDGKSVQDGTPTPSAPVAIDSVESVSAAFAGRNLLKYPSRAYDTDGGVTFTDNNDGSYTISGTATKNTYLYIVNQYSGFTLPAGTYTYSARDANGNTVANLSIAAGVYVGTNPYRSYGLSVGGDLTFTHAGKGNLRIMIFVASGATISNVTVYPQLELASTSTAYKPWTQTYTPIDLQGHELRSLPDGTHDELIVDADGHVTLVQRVGSVTFDGSTSIVNVRAPSSPATATRFVINLPSDAAAITASMRSNFVSDSFTFSANAIGIASQQVDGEASLYQFQQKPAMLGCIEGNLDKTGVSAWLAAHNAKVTYPLATPVTIPLGTVTMPELPAPDMTAWVVTNPSTAIALDYERDLTIAITSIESAIADLATS